MKKRITNFVDKVKKLNLKDKRILVLTLISIFALVTLASTSFALFLKSYETNQKDLLATNDLILAFDDETGNAININPAKPISDAYGSTLEPYTFTITNNGTYKASFDVKLVDSNNLTSDEIDKLKPVLKYQINDNKPQYLKDTDNQILVSGHIKPEQSITYNLRMWIAEEATSEIENLIYTGSISLSGNAILNREFSTNSQVTLTSTTLGNRIRDFKIYGNSIQDGTPTSDTSVGIQSVGDKTINLLNNYDVKASTINQNVAGTLTGAIINNEYIEITRKELYDYALIPVSLKANTSYTIVYDMEIFDRPTDTSQSSALGLGFSDDVKSITVFSNGPLKKVFNYTPTNDVDTNIALYANYGSETPVRVRFKVMLLEGTYTLNNAPEFEPYGKYKIPITVSGENVDPVTTNIFLDEPLRKVSDYADYLDFEKQKVFRNVTVLDDTGTKTIEESYQGTVDDKGTYIELPIITTIDKKTILSVDTSVPATIEGSY